MSKANNRRPIDQRLTDSDVWDILTRYASGERQRPIAKLYGTSEKIIREICERKRFKHLTFPFDTAPRTAGGSQRIEFRLTPEQVQDILAKSASGVLRRQITEEYGISRWTLNRILQRRIFQDVETPFGPPPPSKRFNEAETQEIRQRYATGHYTMEDLGIIYCTSRAMISRLVKGSSSRLQMGLGRLWLNESRLTQKKIAAIRADLETGELHKWEIAQKYDIARKSITRILNQSWKYESR